MKKFFLIFFLLLMSCGKNFDNNYLKNSYNFSDEMTFDEFRLKLEEYAKNSPYPNPDD